MKVQIKFTYKFSQELLSVFQEFSKCKYVNRYSTNIGTESELRQILIDRFQDPTKMAIMTIHYNGEIVGMSFPKNKFTQEELTDFCIDNSYHKIGAIYILPEYRNKEIAYTACKQFLTVYPKIVWHVDETNISSIKLAEKLNLVYSHSFIKKDITYRVYKSI